VVNKKSKNVTSLKIEYAIVIIAEAKIVKGPQGRWRVIIASEENLPRINVEKAVKDEKISKGHNCLLRE